MVTAYKREPLVFAAPVLMESELDRPNAILLVMRVDNLLMLSLFVLLRKRGPDVNPMTFARWRDARQHRVHP